jgi:hypothetical protein
MFVASVRGVEALLELFVFVMSGGGVADEEGFSGDSERARSVEGRVSALNFPLEQCKVGCWVETHLPVAPSAPRGLGGCRALAWQSARRPRGLSSRPAPVFS